MTRGSALISVAALFLSGVAIGALAMFLVLDRSPGVFPRGERPGPQPRHLAMGMMAERLGLTPEQRSRIEQIHRESRREAEEIRREMRPRLEAHIEETRRRIRAVLTPEQLERFDEMGRRFGGRMDRFLLGEGPGGPRRGGPGPRPPGAGPPPDGPPPPPPPPEEDD